MQIVVCVKQVLDSRVPLEVRAPDGAVQQKELKPIWILNPSDRSALEVALQIKEKFGSSNFSHSEGNRDGVKVTALTLGPVQAREVLWFCLARGADRAVHILDKGLEHIDGFLAAWLVSQVLKEQKFGDRGEPTGHLCKPGLILCGKKTLDDGNEIFAPTLAELLDLPQVTNVVYLELIDGGKRIQVERKLERGYRERIECPLPAVIAVDERIAEHRYVSLHARWKVQRQPIQQLNLEVLGINPEEATENQALTRVVKITPPRPRTRKKTDVPSAKLSAADRMKILMGGGSAPKPEKKEEGGLVEGDPNRIADKIIKFLQEKGLI